MGGSLPYLLVFATMSRSVVSEIWHGTHLRDKTHEGKVTAHWNPFRYCADGWLHYSSTNESTCLFFPERYSNFYDAKSYCEFLGGSLVYAATQHKREFLKRLKNKLDSSGRNYWIGLYKGTGPDAQFHWLSIYGTINVAEGSLPENIETYNSVREVCIYLSYYRFEMAVDSCSNSYIYSVCEKDISICPPGTFGQNCKQTCHCLDDEPCSLQLFYGQEVMMCRNGCQRHWTGMSCNIEKPAPDLQYYCINATETDTAYVYIAIFTKGLQYRDIYGLNSNNERDDWCQSTIVETDNYNLTTITISINNVSIEQMSNGQCAGQQLDDQTFTWEIVVKEKADILLDNDLKMTIHCNFSVADSFESFNRYSIERYHHHRRHQLYHLYREAVHLTEKSFDPYSGHDDVHLELVRGYSGELVTEAAVGTVVFLRMKYALKKGSRLTGVSPYNCVAFSPDKKHFAQLLNEHGCPAKSSPIEAFQRRQDNQIETPWFHLFALEDSPSVTFQCSFNVCFKSTCHVGCRSSPRHRRDTGNVENEEEPQSITRTIRVLPSIHAKQAAGERQVEDYQPPAGPPASAPGYHMGPAVYLNPVTCSLFLIILLVFLCMYIAFIRTLRKSVYDIRREIEVRRSRDKFLHCGCVQQKDLDYVETRT